MRIGVAGRSPVLVGLTLALAVGIGCPAWAQQTADKQTAALADQAPPAQAAVSEPAPGTAAAPSAEAAPDQQHPSTVRHSVKKLAKAIALIPKEFKAVRQDLFAKAAAAFPSFCDDWERKLRAREVDNVNHLGLTEHEGWLTGTYVGYSKLKTCVTKRSTGGTPIGELTYQEIQYYVAGKTDQEAKHAQPKPVNITHTTEIFRWDKSKWSYE